MALTCQVTLAARALIHVISLYTSRHTACWICGLRRRWCNNGKCKKHPRSTLVVNAGAPCVAAEHSCQRAQPPGAACHLVFMHQLQSGTVHMRGPTAARSAKIHAKLAPPVLHTRSQCMYSKTFPIVSHIVSWDWDICLGGCKTHAEWILPLNDVMLLLLMGEDDNVCNSMYAQVDAKIASVHMLHV